MIFDTLKTQSKILIELRSFVWTHFTTLWNCHVSLVNSNNRKTIIVLYHMKSGFSLTQWRIMGPNNILLTLANIDQTLIIHMETHVHRKLVLQSMVYLAGNFKKTYGWQFQPPFCIWSRPGHPRWWAASPHCRSSWWRSGWMLQTIPKRRSGKKFPFTWIKLWKRKRKPLAPDNGEDRNQARAD